MRIPKQTDAEIEEIRKRAERHSRSRVRSEDEKQKRKIDFHIYGDDDVLEDIEEREKLLNLNEEDDIW